MTVEEAINNYIRTVQTSRSQHTARSYRNALKLFQEILNSHHFSTQTEIIQNFDEDKITLLLDGLKNFSPATEQLYLMAAKNFYEYLAAENLVEINLPRLRLFIKQRSRRQGQRLPQFPRNNIEYIVNYAINLADAPSETINEKLRNLRDRAFLVVLADTGLRVHEACALRRGQVDWNEGRAVIVGKGNREAVIRFSSRSLSALRDYISARAKLDGASGRPLPSLPLFARHDKGSGKKVKPISTATGRNIVSQRLQECLGDEAAGTITPHSFRHYFVTTVLQGSGNLKLAQELARHRNIAVTQRYAHLSDDELDKGYHEIFD